MFREELDAWQDYLIGKPCPIHGTVIKKGKYGPWCGNKKETSWCSGGWPTDEWLEGYRKEHEVFKNILKKYDDEYPKDHELALYHAEIEFKELTNK